MLVPKPLILFIDAYDSFSNNIISLLETTLNASVRTVKIDSLALADDAALHKELSHYAAVVCGPGPGHPVNEKDVGIMQRIWRLSDEEMLPALGVCLGFQSLCLEFGATVKRLNGPQHGIVRKITTSLETLPGHGGSSIFDGTKDLEATLYHSLCVDIGQNTWSENAWKSCKWGAYGTGDNTLIPLAWAEMDLEVENNAGIKDSRVLVGVQHKFKPFWGLQYHPESICTDAGSKIIISNWFTEAQNFNRYKRKKLINFDGPILGECATRQSLLHQFEQRIFREPAPTTDVKKLGEVASYSDEGICHWRTAVIPAATPVWQIVEALGGEQHEQIILESSNAYDRSLGTADVRGRYSIVGIDVHEAMRIEYTTGQDNIKWFSQNGSGSFSKHTYGGIWQFLAQYMESKRVSAGPVGSPFWGGFMGYTSYEMGLEGIDVQLRNRGSRHKHPDMAFAWVTKSIVIDHIANLVYIQEVAPRRCKDIVEWRMAHITERLEHMLLPEASFEPHTITVMTTPGLISDANLVDTLFQDTVVPFRRHHLTATTRDLSRGVATLTFQPSEDVHCIAKVLDGQLRLGHKIRAFVKNDYGGPASAIYQMQHVPMTSVPNNFVSHVKSITTPSHVEYEDKVRKCQQFIRSGDSYELCLTAHSTVSLHTAVSSWTLYKAIRAHQPAPFASYVRLGDATFVSCSPERFLKWSSDGVCELRPMKGTVKKSPTVSTLAQATELLNVPKELAENLMIVDLVRHDLHGVCGSGNVSVPRLMVVEEYKSVFQMISIVKAQIPVAVNKNVEPHLPSSEVTQARRSRYTGLDALSASLPPGSMTGAPKKRSCEILQDVEKAPGGERQERGLYSGVVGYMDVAGRGDWSVNIRCMFKWDDEQLDRENGEQEKWHVGAGGAVTILSTPEGEREEMVTKLAGTLGLFR